MEESTFYDIEISLLLIDFAQNILWIASNISYQILLLEMPNNDNEVLKCQTYWTLYNDYCNPYKYDAIMAYLYCKITQHDTNWLVAVFSACSNAKIQSWNEMVPYTVFDLIL